MHANLLADAPWGRSFERAGLPSLLSPVLCGAARWRQRHSAAACLSGRAMRQSTHCSRHHHSNRRGSIALVTDSRPACARCG